MSISKSPVIQYFGSESFEMKGKPEEFAIADFWRWACTDLLNNTMRGVLAEFIVSRALGLASGYRTEWDAFDLETQAGLKIELKSSAYLQSWEQARYSNISFGIQPTRGWNAKTNEISELKQRQADAYIFCLLAEKDPEKVNPMALEQWEFYILNTEVLNQELGDQKTLSLGRLRTLDPVQANYSNLSDEIQRLEKQISNNRRN